MARPDDTSKQEESNQNGQQAPLDSHISHDDDEAPEIIAAPTIPLERAPTAPVDPHQDIATMAVDDAETKEEEHANHVTVTESMQEHANHVTVTESMQEQLSPVLDDEEWMDSNGPNNTSTTVNGGVVDTERLLELGYDDEYDDRTLLDVFAAAAKEWLTHKAVRTTFGRQLLLDYIGWGQKVSHSGPSLFVAGRMETHTYRSRIRIWIANGIGVHSSANLRVSVTFSFEKGIII